MNQRDVQSAAPSARHAESTVDSTTSAWADHVVEWFLRHWLAVVLAPLLLFSFLPFLAPVAIAAGWTGMGRAIYLLYVPFCHQLPQRSWFLFGEKFTYTLTEIAHVYPSLDPANLRFFYGAPEMGWKVAWSDRMISFYTMTPVFGVLYGLLRHWWPRLRPLPLPLFLLALTPIAVDGLTHAVSDLLYGVSSGGFRDTNAWLATLTGNAWPGFYAGDHFGTFNWWMRLLTGLLAAWGVAFYGFPWINRFMRRELTRDGATSRHEIHVSYVPDSHAPDKET